MWFILILNRQAQVPGSRNLTSLQNENGKFLVLCEVLKMSLDNLPEVKSADVAFHAYNSGEDFAAVWPQAPVRHLH